MVMDVRIRTLILVGNQVSCSIRSLHPQAKLTFFGYKMKYTDV